MSGLPDQTGRINYVDQAAGLTVFAYNFKVWDKSELEVLKNTVALTVDVDYTVTGVGVDGGGSITLITATILNDDITVMRKQPISITSVYLKDEDFPSTRVQKDFERTGFWSQMIRERLDRALKFKKASIKSNEDVDDPVVGKFLRAKNPGPGFDWATPTNAGALTSPVPIADGGTGSTTAAVARTALAIPGLADENTFTQRNHWNKGANIVAAATLTPGVDGNFFHVTGSTGITAIAAKPPGSILFLLFEGTPTLTHSAALFMHGAVDYTAVANDILMFVSEGSGNWREAVPFLSAIPTVPVAATQAEQEAASLNTVFTTPGRQHFHPGMLKAFIRFTIAGVIEASYNIASVDDDGVGDWGVNFTTAFASATTYGGNITWLGTPNNQALAVMFDALNTTSGEIALFNSTNAVRNESNATSICAAFYGDFA